ncbi:hypothetical protein [Paraburkholderia elongata]|uniref:Uncharacterized protein n=1 Tax=Paraburkholderia elongata TaxID=2675747 RepID=A0A972NNV4_9BURK|nr:hypothetical protein [Paraburkholderia elongata]NPT56341.1 hypothetical protein [Paraburkholderia elongata]
MAAKRKSKVKDIASTGISISGDDLKQALKPIATALSEELAALLAAVMDGRKKKTLDRLSQALSEAVPSLLQRVIEDDLLADSDADRERRATLVAALRAREMPARLQQAKSARQGPAHGADDSTDWMSADAVARLLNVSPAHVKKLSQDGKLGDVDTDANGVMRLERTAVLVCYEQMKRRQQMGRQETFSRRERGGDNVLPAATSGRQRKGADRP